MREIEGEREEYLWWVSVYWFDLHKSKCILLGKAAIAEPGFCVHSWNVLLGLIGFDLISLFDSKVVLVVTCS